jgi:DNA-binding NarL/FixJ family response regulator
MKHGDESIEPDVVSVIVVDDQAPFRAAARAVMARARGFELVGEASSGEEAVELVDRLRPALVLMDINMGVMDGLEATRIIVAARPATVVVLVSTYTEAEMPPAARTCGAAAYVNKDELSPRLLRRLWEAGGDPDWPAGRLITPPVGSEGLHLE